MPQTSRRILVIDDDPDILEFLQILLEDEGYTVVISEEGEYIKSLQTGELPHLILLDMLLSGKDGRDIVRYLKSQDETKAIPVIMFSAHPSAERTVREAGADDFLAKPFSIDVLLAKIVQYL